jgi:hypothetical protein
MDGAEIEFSNLLVEDTNNDAMSYIDCELISLTVIIQYLKNGSRFMLCAQANKSSGKSFRNGPVAHLYLFSQLVNGTNIGSSGWRIPW